MWVVCASLEDCIWCMCMFRATEAEWGGGGREGAAQCRGEGGPG